MTDDTNPFIKPILKHKLLSPVVFNNKIWSNMFIYLANWKELLIFLKIVGEIWHCKKKTAFLDSLFIIK